MPAPAGFVLALVDYAESITDGIEELQAERARLYVEIKNGDGGALVSSTVNGKQFGWQGNLTLEEKFAAFNEAIGLLSGSRVTTTYAAFRHLQR